MHTRTYKKIISLCILIIAVLAIFTFIYKAFEIQTSADISVNYTDLVAVSDSNANTESEDSNSCLLPVENILQNPELPSGCEITSLTIVLNYLGYDVSKETMAEDYLVTSTSATTNLYEAFRGNPFNNTGYGCYSPVIVKAANDYLEDAGGSETAYDLTGSSLEELFAQIDAGNPVIIWGSVDVDEEITFDYTWISDGETMVWSSLQHCMVLIGYDLDKQVVYVANPLVGIEEYELDTLNERYTEYFSQAVVVY